MLLIFNFLMFVTVSDILSVPLKMAAKALIYQLIRNHVSFPVGQVFVVHLKAHQAGML